MALYHSVHNTFLCSIRMSEHTWQCAYCSLQLTVKDLVVRWLSIHITWSMWLLNVTEDDTADVNYFQSPGPVRSPSRAQSQLGTQGCAVATLASVSWLYVQDQPPPTHTQTEEQNPRAQSSTCLAQYLWPQVTTWMEHEKEACCLTSPRWGSGTCVNHGYAVTTFHDKSTKQVGMLEAVTPLWGEGEGCGAWRRVKVL